MFGVEHSTLSEYFVVFIFLNSRNVHCQSLNQSYISQTYYLWNVRVYPSPLLKTKIFSVFTAFGCFLVLFSLLGAFWCFLVLFGNFWNFQPLFHLFCIFFVHFSVFGTFEYFQHFWHIWNFLHFFHSFLYFSTYGLFCALFMLFVIFCDIFTQLKKIKSEEIFLKSDL